MRRFAAATTTWSAGFWEAASVHRFVIPRCNRTGNYFFPPERCVPGTNSTDWSYVESSGVGIVTTFTVVYRPPSGDFAAPYVLAVVSGVEGWTYLTNIVGCPPDAVRIGMPVRVTYEDAEGVSLPVFTPAEF
ncbi:Zn-ribbon domain-containing OB-fold protein [Prescottella equi]